MGAQRNVLALTLVLVSTSRLELKFETGLQTN